MRLISGDDAQSWVDPNFIRNRYFRAAQDFLHVSSGSPSEHDQNFQAVLQAHGDGNEWTWDYLRNPMNTFFVRGLLRGQLKAAPIVSSMIQKDGRMRLLTLRILLAQNQVAETDVERFLSKQTSALRNPFTDEPMRWNAKNRVIWFCQSGHPNSSAQVKLPGGRWFENLPNECVAPRNKV